MDKRFRVLNGKTVLVTGGAGAIGGNLVKFLSAHGAKVVVIDDLSAGFADNLSLGRKVVFYEDTILNDEILKKVFKERIDYIFHLAAHFANQNSIDHPCEDLLTNALGTLKLLEYGRRHAVKRFIYASSSCVYGSTDKKMTEDLITRLETPYAVSKLTGEEYVHFYHRYYRMKATVVRYFNAYGPGDPPGRYRNVIPNFFMLAAKGKPLVITGTGRETRDFTFMDDVIRGTVLTVTTDASMGEIYNIGSGRETEILRLAKSINKITGSKAGIEFTALRKWDAIRKRVANIKKSRNQLGYEPVVGLEDGLARTWTWFKERYGV
ncbi:MAG: NAD-dependent epimerase/dehydratase family protein [Candidatus Omnitrophota bacterium]